MIWTRTKQNASQSSASKLTGIDINSSRLRMVSISNGSTLTQHFHNHEELALALLLDARKPVIGQPALKATRLTPHLVCGNFLAQLGQAREWRGPRIALTPETALAAVLESLPLSDPFVLALPAYLSASQVQVVRDSALRLKLPLKATVTAALAIAAHRAMTILAAAPLPAKESPEWVVPMKAPTAGPGSVLILDADDYALNASLLEVTPAQVKRLTQTAWPRVSVKLWKERLLDAISDRCVRLCRRDPRDSAVAEQGLWDQLDAAMDSTRLGHGVTLTARADHWHQELALNAADFEGFCSAFLKIASDGLHELITNVALPLPPKSVWLTPTAARLPGLAAMIYDQCTEGTDVAILPADAGAEAAAALQARMMTGALSGEHHWSDTIPVEVFETRRVRSGLLTS